MSRRHLDAQIAPLTLWRRIGRFSDHSSTPRAASPASGSRRGPGAKSERLRVIEGGGPAAGPQAATAVRPALSGVVPGKLGSIGVTPAVAMGGGLASSEIGSGWVLPPPGTLPVGGHLKRALDMAAAACALILLAPLLVVVSVLVKLTMGGPVIFSHSRVGFGGGRFRCFKFRTMVQNAEAVLEEHLSRNPDLRQEWEANQKLVVDPRTTGLGRLLRKSSLDELPQLVNVLRGEMSLIGPRPVTAAELGRYGADAAHYLRARPGLTGLWQVSGRSKLVYARRVALDSAYVQNWSLALDLRILLRTIPALLSPDKTS